MQEMTFYDAGVDLLQMQTNMEIDGKTIRRYGATDKSVPVVYLHTFQHEGEAIYQQCQKIGTRQFILVEIDGVDWNAEMSPWPAEPIFKGEGGYAGNAGKWLATLLSSVISNVEKDLHVSKRYLAGYSLAGLFALWAAYQTDAFDGIISGSGSLWYPHFLDFVHGHTWTKEPECIYLSLGDRERVTRNPVLSTIEDNTRQLYEEYKSAGLNVIFELNNGNHYMQPDWRMAKGIQWTLRSHSTALP